MRKDNNKQKRERKREKIELRKMKRSKISLIYKFL